jgi:Derlin-2/3
MYFMIRYSRMLEEGSFRNRQIDYIWLFVFSGVLLLLSNVFIGSLFLGSTLTYILVYIWSRREPWIQLNFLGLFIFQAPFLPWVFL